MIALHLTSYHFRKHGFLSACSFISGAFGGFFFEECCASFAGVFPEAGRKKKTIEKCAVRVSFVSLVSGQLLVFLKRISKSSVGLEGSFCLLLSSNYSSFLM